MRQRQSSISALGIATALPDHVTYVGVDFNTQSLAERLPAEGYDPRRKTFFIWQGVTQYLTADAVDDTLSFVATHSGPGGAILFDFVEPQVLAEHTEHGEVRRMRRYRWMSGETLTFGIALDQVGEFLEKRGFDDVEVVDHHDLEARYFPDGSRTVTAGYGIATARVETGR